MPLSKSLATSFEEVTKNLRYDLPASVIVFLVAIPLCLGIAVASGAPPFAGIISGFVGGIVITLASGSALGVSGPAAGLVAIVIAAIEELGSFEAFLVATVLAGIIQVIVGLLRGGTFAYYFPTSVIKGMLAGIGLVIILKMLPDAFGFPKGMGLVAAFANFGETLHLPSLVITVVGLAILILWDQPFIKQYKVFQLIQGPLVATIVGILMGIWFLSAEGFRFNPEIHLINFPVAESIGGFFQQFRSPDFSFITNPQVYVTAVTIAIVASLESLLCVEATDKLDPWKRVTPRNREMVAQGIGNFTAGMIGGLPVTQVIIRSSTNIMSGARTQTSAFVHGLLLLGGSMMFPAVLNMVPMAALAAILLMVGYNLAHPKTVKQFYSSGVSEFVPYLATALGIVIFDLLIGVGLGLVLAFLFILWNHLRNPYRFHITDEKHQTVHLELAEEVSFLNKAALQETLYSIPEGYHVVIDGSRTHFLHPDIYDLIRDFEEEAREKNITVEFRKPGRETPETEGMGRFKRWLAEHHLPFGHNEYQSTQGRASES